MRTLATVLAFPALIGLSFAIGAIVPGESDTVVVVVGLAAAVAYGAVVQRWWAVLMPVVWGAAYLAVMRVSDLITGACSVCGTDEDWSNAPFLLFFLFVVPLSGAVAVGLTARRAARVTERPGDAAPPPRTAG